MERAKPLPISSDNASHRLASLGLDWITQRVATSRPYYGSCKASGVNNQAGRRIALPIATINTFIYTVSPKEAPEMRNMRLVQFVFAGLVWGCGAQGAPITYTLTATASGTLAGMAFTNAAIRVTSITDTNDVFVSGTIPNLIYEVLPASSDISIAGFGTAVFTDQMFWEDPNGAGDIIFGDVAVGHPILGFTRLFSGLESYDLKSSFGPVSAPVDFVTMFFNGFDNIPTGIGNLTLTASNDTFTAVVTPEPTSFLLAGLAILGFQALRLVVRLRMNARRSRRELALS
jgi:hypothetical protein